MKETPIFEEVFSRILRLPGLWVGVLVGGLLSFIPILNIFAFGYLLRLSRGIRQSGNPALPAWSDWSGLFIDGLKFAVVWLVYWLLPLLIVSVIALIIGMLGLGALAYLLMSVVFLLAPILFSSALYRYSMRSDFKDLLDIALIIRMSYGSFPRLIIPALAFVGIFAVLFPLYGFAVFFGSLAFL
ncbi:MAG: DUF4013 domain-containing protein, partial [Opitutales bacterium]